MKIYLTSAYPTHPMLSEFRLLAAQDAVGRHSLCEHPDEADVIFFVENAHFDDYLYKKLRQHPLVLRFPNKVYMYNEVDRPWCALPGLYGSMPRRYLQENRQVAFGFIHTPNDFVKKIYQPNDASERRWLFSFVGALSHRCRKQIMRLSEATPALQDTSYFNVWHCNADTKASEGHKYASVMGDSRFVLCPRGTGTSSFRLFESMQAGRCPVIISNQWVEPPCVDWDFAVRIPEHKIQGIPGYLKSIADEAFDRGVAGRLEWEKTFAPDRFFDTAVETLGTLVEARQRSATRMYLHTFRKAVVRGEVGLYTAVRRMRTRLVDLASDLTV